MSIRYFCRRISFFEAITNQKLVADAGVPRRELEGNKWLTENFDNPGSMIEIEASISHSILISRCTKTTIRVIGKRPPLCFLPISTPPTMNPDQLCLCH